ncbi:MAG: hypothetical protein IKI30_01565 [Oxalobacter sp.]|nr:hypothetical protein [Oxalobacter sp.]
MSSYTIIIPLFVFFALVYVFWCFWKQNIKKAKALAKQLEGATERISEIKESGLSEDEKLSEMAAVFKDTEWKQLWSEFAETLHEQKESDEDGIMRTVRVRATVSSQFFFSDSVVIDSVIKTEIYKHIPGVFTACGIIGTFAGLICGLLHFDASDLMHIQQGVSELLSAVRDAFFASFFAIVLSVVAIWLERESYKGCTDNLSRLTAAIDSLYDAGLENEFLESIARSSEESANQSKQLKDGLVSELKPLLQNLVDNQIEELKPMLQEMVQAQMKAVEHQNLVTDRLVNKLSEMAGTITAGFREETEKSASNISSGISSSIVEAFKEPLEKIAGSVQEASGQQTEAAGETLKIVLDKFMAQMDSTILGRQQDMIQTMQEAQGTLRSMSSDISNLIDQIKSTGISAQEALSEKMAGSLEMINSSQIQMQNQMRSFIEQIQSTVSSSQGQMTVGLENTIKSVENSMADILTNIGSSSNEVQEGMSKVNVGLAKTLEVISSAGKRYERAADSIANTLEKASGVIRLGTDLLQGTNQSARALSGVSERVEQASLALQQVLDDYIRARNDVSDLIDRQQQEASSRKEVIEQLSAHQKEMRELDVNATAYLEKVNELLTQNFEAYSKGLAKTTDEIVSNLALASGQIKNSVDDLQDNIEELNDILEKGLRKNG